MSSATPLLDEQRRKRSAAAITALLEIARDLTASLAARDRYDAARSTRVRRVIPVRRRLPAAARRRRARARRRPRPVRDALEPPLRRREHPRLDVILRSPGPGALPGGQPAARPLRRPARGRPARARAHPRLPRLRRSTEGGEVVGALTADALEPRRLRRARHARAGHAGGAGRRRAAHHRADRGAGAARASTAGQVARDLQRSARSSAAAGILGDEPGHVQRLREEIALVAALRPAGARSPARPASARSSSRAAPRRARRGADEALIDVNCAALPESIAESELFGHVRARSPAPSRDRAGSSRSPTAARCSSTRSASCRSTLQPKLLRALQQGEIQRVGADRAAPRRRARHRGHQPRPRARGARGPLPRRPLLPPRGVPAPRAAAARARATTSRCSPRTSPTRAPARSGSAPRAPRRRRAAPRSSAADWPGNVRELENVVSRGGAARRGAAASRRPS